MLEDFTRLNEALGINEPMFLPKEENIELLEECIGPWTGRKHTEESKKLMRKYHTLEEKQAARARNAKRYYQKNRETILQKIKDKKNK